jgi:hypothetical protein
MGYARQLKDVLGYEPILPEPAELDPAQIVVRYHELGDELYVHFFGLGHPGVSVDLNEYLYMRVNDETHKVVGIHIEAYLAFAVRQDPRWLAWAELAGIPAEAIEAVRHEISLEKKREAALQTTFEELELAIA